MKTKNLLSRFTAAALVAAAALLPTALTSCSSEADQPTPDPDPIPEGMARITLSMSNPALSASTRGEGDPIYVNAAGDEGKLSTLYVYFFRKGGDNTYTCWNAFQVSTTGTHSETQATMSRPDKLTDEYQTILSGANIPQGDYHIYVLANITNNSLTTFSGTSGIQGTTEAAFRQAIVTGSSSSSTLPSAGQLPMGSDYTDLKLDGTHSGASISSGTLTINSGQINLKTDLGFLCSKVRCTVLFDPTAPSGEGATATEAGFSFPLTQMTWNSATFKQLANNVYIFDEPDEYTQSFFSSDLGATLTSRQYPSDEWLTTDDGTAADLTTQSASPTAKQAYQGTFYMYENLASAKDDKTYLEIKAAIDGTGQDYYRTFPLYLPTAADGTNDNVNVLTRGHYYDIIAKVRATGLAIDVRIKDWTKTATDRNEL